MQCRKTKDKDTYCNQAHDIDLSIQLVLDSIFHFYNSTHPCCLTELLCRCLANTGPCICILTGSTIYVAFPGLMYRQSLFLVALTESPPEPSSDRERDINQYTLNTWNWLGPVLTTCCLQSHFMHTTTPLCNSPQSSPFYWVMKQKHRESGNIHHSLISQAISHLEQTQNILFGKS